MLLALQLRLRAMIIRSQTSTSIVGSTDYAGLFGYLGSGGGVCNLGLEGGSVTGNDYVGGLVGN